MEQTALERVLQADGGPMRPTPLDALAAARRMWLAEQRIEMGALAAELGISRATLYNWVGDKERLLGEVLWSIAETTIARARAEARGSGAEFISDLTERYLYYVASSDAVRKFLSADPELALRVLTCNRTSFQGRLIAVVQDLIEEQIRSASYQPPLEPSTLAYLLVRIGESFIFNDVITGSEPDLAKAAQASRVLLHAPPAPDRRRRRPASSR
jgi:AcrR family transcriptional regulator